MREVFRAKLSTKDGICLWLVLLDCLRALEESAIAERGLPNDSRILEATASIWRRQGKFEAAVDRLEGALELSPKDAACRQFDVVRQSGLGNGDVAIAADYSKRDSICRLSSSKLGRREGASEDAIARSTSDNASCGRPSFSALRAPPSTNSFKTYGLFTG